MCVGWKLQMFFSLLKAQCTPNCSLGVSVGRQFEGEFRVSLWYLATLPQSALSQGPGGEVLEPVSVVKDPASDMATIAKKGSAVRDPTSNTTRKATVAYPTVKRLLFHMFYAMYRQQLLKSHEMV